MSERLLAALAQAEAGLKAFSTPPVVEDRVLDVTAMLASCGSSPVECTLVLAQTSMSAATGMTGALLDGLHATEIYDIETLRQVTALLHASADLFAAILNEAGQ